MDQRKAKLPILLRMADAYFCLILIMLYFREWPPPETTCSIYQVYAMESVSRPYSRYTKAWVTYKTALQYCGSVLLFPRSSSFKRDTRAATSLHLRRRLGGLSPWSARWIISSDLLPSSFILLITVQRLGWALAIVWFHLPWNPVETSWQYTIKEPLDIFFL